MKKFLQTNQILDSLKKFKSNINPKKKDLKSTLARGVNKAKLIGKLKADVPSEEESDEIENEEQKEAETHQRNLNLISLTFY